MRQLKHALRCGMGKNISVTHPHVGGDSDIAITANWLHEIRLL